MRLLPYALVTVLLGCAAPARSGLADGRTDGRAEPTITLTARGVLVDGVLVKLGTAGEPGELKAALARSAPSGTPYRLEVKSKAHVEDLQAVLMLASISGYDQVHFPTRDLIARHPGPQESRQEVHIRVELKPEGDKVAFNWLTDGPCDRAPHGAEVPASELAGTFAKLCGGRPCIDNASVKVDPADFDSSVRALEAVSRSGTPNFTFDMGASWSAEDGCGEPFVEVGFLPQEAIQRPVQASFGRLRACYEAVLAKDPNAGGRAVVYFVIERDGRVSEASKWSFDFGDATFETCILDGFRQVVFPPPFHGRMKVVYPIIFNPAPPATETTKAAP